MTQNLRDVMAKFRHPRKTQLSKLRLKLENIGNLKEFLEGFSDSLELVSRLLFLEMSISDV